MFVPDFDLDKILAGVKGQVINSDQEASVLKDM